MWLVDKNKPCEFHMYNGKNKMKFIIDYGFYKEEFNKIRDIIGSILNNMIG